jgi:RecA-family ATPase
MSQQPQIELHTKIHNVITTEANIKELLYSPFEAENFLWPSFKEGEVGAIIGPGASGKSFFGLEAAIGLAGGPSVDKHLLNLGVVGQRKAIYMNAEDDPITTRNRFRYATHQFKNFDPSTSEAIADNFRMWFAKGHQVDIGAKDPEGDSINFEVKEIISEVRAWHADLIIFDTLIRFHNLNENDNAQMGRLISIFERIRLETGVAVLYIHHTSKEAAFNADTRSEFQGAARGAMALTDNVRYVNNIFRMTKLEAENFEETYKDPEKSRLSYVKSSVAKQNASEDSLPRWFTHTEGGVLREAKLTPTLDKKREKTNEEKIERY